jgi:ATP-dependent Clp protease protease subunit
MKIPPELPVPARPSPWQPTPPPPGTAPPVAPSVTIPIGSGDPGAWLQEHLMRQRIVLARGDLTHDMATLVSAQLLTLDAEGDGPVELHLGTPTGDLDAALTVLDAIDAMRVPVHALAVGTVGGPALAVFAAARERRAFPHATFHLTEPRLRAEGTASEIGAREEHNRSLLAALYGRLADVTGRDTEDLADDARRGRFLTAADAVDYGLASEIVRPSPNTR